MKRPKFVVRPHLEGLCECGHSENEHGLLIRNINGTRFPLERHGKCGHADCTCEEFLWVAFVEDPEPVASDD